MCLVSLLIAWLFFYDKLYWNKKRFQHEKKCSMTEKRPQSNLKGKRNTYVKAKNTKS